MNIPLYHADGRTVDCPSELVESWLKKPGWSRDCPASEPVAPVLDFASYDNTQLLHIASVNSLTIDSDATRAQVEELLRAKWGECGQPPHWLSSSVAMAAPQPEELDIPSSHSEDETIETPEEFAGRIHELRDEGEVATEEESTDG